MFIGSLTLFRLSVLIMCPVQSGLHRFQWDAFHSQFSPNVVATLSVPNFQLPSSTSFPPLSPVPPLNAALALFLNTLQTPWHIFVFVYWYNFPLSRPSDIYPCLAYYVVHTSLPWCSISGFSPSHLSASTLRSVPARIMTCQCPRSSAISVVFCILWTSWLPGFARASPSLLLPPHSLLLSTLPPSDYPASPRIFAV